jgi:hypothetical protein
LKTISAADPAAMNAQIDAEVKILDLKTSALDRQIATLDIVENIEAVERLSAERNALQAQKDLILARKTETIKIAEVKQREKLFKLEQRSITSFNKNLTLSKQIFELEQKNILSKANADIAEETKYANVLKFQEQIASMEEVRYQSRLTAIDLEYELLIAQEKLNKANAEAAVNRGLLDSSVLAQYDHFITLLEEGHQSALQTAKTQHEYNKLAQEALEIETKRAAINAAFARTQARLTLKADTSNLFGGDLSANSANLEKAANVTGKLAGEIKGLLFASPEWLQKSLELDIAINEELALQITRAEILTGMFREIAGTNFGNFMNIANLMPAFEALDTESLVTKIQFIHEAFKPLLEDIKELGPEGVLVSAIAESGFAITETFAYITEEIEGGIGSLQGGLTAAAAIINSIASIQSASSKAAIDGIERQIEAEKKRDGKSAQSLAKLSALENKKEKMARKAFETNKKLMMAQTVVNTAAAMVGVLAHHAPEMGVFAAITAAMIGALGAAQLAIIAGTSYQGGGSVSAPAAPSSISAGGDRSSTVDLAKAKSPSGEIAFARGAQGVGGMTNFTPTFTGRATGGNVGLTVGEQGAELFVPDRPGTILPADDTADVLARGGASNVTFTINAIDTQGMEDALTRQRGNIIRMLREAANDHGEFFLESVNVMEDGDRL